MTRDRFGKRTRMGEKVMPFGRNFPFLGVHEKDKWLKPHI